MLLSAVLHSIIIKLCGGEMILIVCICIFFLSLLMEHLFQICWVTLHQTDSCLLKCGIWIHVAEVVLSYGQTKCRTVSVNSSKWSSVSQWEVWQAAIFIHFHFLKKFIWSHYHESGRLTAAFTHRVRTAVLYQTVVHFAQYPVSKGGLYQSFRGCVYIRAFMEWSIHVFHSQFLVIPSLGLGPWSSLLIAIKKPVFWPSQHSIEMSSTG